MANAVLVGKKLVLGYEEGTYSFSKFDALADEEDIYRLAGILNSFQSERPPVSVTCITTRQIM